MILLTGSLIALFRLLSKQSEQIRDESAFKNEKRTLMVILVFFDLTYFGRLYFDLWWSSNKGKFIMLAAVLAILCRIVLDLLPVCLILYFHTRNFKQAKS
mmetsp:Transcript_533/g.845  ORF Transcript_533/g.845 Transcript_533/m.845 type:complete len:100 (+) Transcript_533:222-521(+)